MLQLPSPSPQMRLPFYLPQPFGPCFIGETSRAEASFYLWRGATAILYADANDGGIKRGDRGDVDDTEARPSVKNPAAENKNQQDPGPPDVDDDTSDVTARDPDASDTEVLDAEDASLGLTDIGSVPPDDWAADTGETRTGESRQK